MGVGNQWNTLLFLFWDPLLFIKSAVPLDTNVIYQTDIHNKVGWP